MKKQFYLFLSTTAILSILFYLGYSAYLGSEINNLIDKNRTGLKVFYFDLNNTLLDSEIVKKLSNKSFKNSKSFEDNIFIRAVGVFSAPKNGHYKFFLRTAGAGRLFIDNKIIIDDCGIHKILESRKTIFLQKGLHFIAVEYFRAYEKFDLGFMWQFTRKTEKTDSLEKYFIPALPDFKWDNRHIYTASLERIQGLKNNLYLMLVWLNVLAFFALFFLAFRKRIDKFYLNSKNNLLIQSIIRYVCYCSPYIFILTAGILNFRDIIFSSGPALQIHDLEMHLFPRFYFIRKAFIAGEFPFWDPYSMLGQPCAFYLGLCALYPFLIGFLSLKFLGPLLPRQFELFMVYHLILSGFTMYWAARKLGLSKSASSLSGAIFISAVVVKESIHMFVYVIGIPWIPLVLCYSFYIFKSRNSIFSKENLTSASIALLTLSLVISTMYPNLIIYTYITIGIMAVYFMIEKIMEQDWRGILLLFSKAFIIFITPLLFTAIISLPSFAILPDAVRQHGETYGFGSLLPPVIWTLILPGFGKYMQGSFAYAGVITIFLACYFCITNNNKAKNHYFLYVLLAVFWFYFSIEGSIVAKKLSHLPVLNKMRMGQYGLIMYVYFICILAGKGLEKLYDFRKHRIKINLNWLLPIFLAAALLFSFPSFLSESHKNFSITCLKGLLFGCIFMIFLIFQRFIKNRKIKLSLYSIVPIIIISEILIASPFFIYRSEAEVFFPYKPKLDKLAADFPECFKGRDLYRFENFSEYMIAEYYFNRYSAYGFYAQGMHPARYYYLWNKLGETGPRFEKWYTPSLINPLPLDSKLYDLAGIKYFYLPEYEWLFIDYKRSGEGEWIEIKLGKKILTSGIGIYNPENISGKNWTNKRRILRARIILNGKKAISIEIPDSAGWHKFYFKPINLHKFKIIADEVFPFGINEGSSGIVIGEVELLDNIGNKLDVPDKSFNASSTMLVSNPGMIMDGRPDYAWESRCKVIAEKTIPNKNLERFREGCYINKNVLPRAFLVHKYKYVRNKDELLKELHSNEFAPAEVVLLEEPVDFKENRGPYDDYVKITKYGLNEAKIIARNDKPGILILSDMYAKSWDVFVNGKKEKLLTADGLFRGVVLNKGKHNVYFKYTPPLFKLGSLISLFSFFLLVILFLYYYI